MLPGENAFSYNDANGDLSMRAEVQDISNLVGNTFPGATGSFTMPSDLPLSGKLKLLSQSFQRDVYESNLSNTINTPVQGFSISNSNGEKENVKNLSKPIDIALSVISRPVVEESLSRRRRLLGLPTSERINLFCEVSAEPYNVTANCSQGNTSFQCDGKTTGSITVSCPVLTVRPVCVYWNDLIDEWATDGCSVKQDQGNAVICSCSHLTDFGSKFEFVFSETEAIIAMDALNPEKGGKKVESFDDFANLVATNSLVFITVLVLLIIIFCACFQGHYKDSHEYWRLKLKKDKYRKLLFSSSKGIVHDPSKQPDFSRESLWEQFVFGMKNFHPVLSIYYTHSLTISRPNRVMALMVVLMVNMFFDAMFFNVRYPDPSQKPELFEALVFAMAISLVNVPICKAFEALYIMAGAAYAAHVRYEVEAEMTLKLKGVKFLSKVRMKIKTKKDAEDYLRLVEGYSRVVEKSLVKARSQQIIAPSTTTVAKSAAKRISNLRKDYKILFSHKKAAYKKYFKTLKEKKIEEWRIASLLRDEAKREVNAAKKCCSNVQSYFLYMKKLNNIKRGKRIK